MLGQTLGSYRIVEQIGMGGMATVYKAYDSGTDRYVAVKVLPEHYSNDPHFKKRFEREAKAIARLEHPHILPVFAFGEQEDITYLVMRYMPTGTLKERLEEGRIGWEEASTILSQVAGGLDYAHEHGILHRDVKPSNILLDGKGNAYLTDFGIAKIVEVSVELTGAGILGTPAYMSPEQCRGGKDLTPASDQYALGVVLYQMVTERTPFQAETPLALVYMQLNDPLPPPRTLRADLPEDIERVLLKALAKAPGERFPSCAALAEAFARAVAAEVETRPSAPTLPVALTYDVTLPVAPPRPVRRTRPWLWPLIAILILAGLAGGAFALGWLPPSQPSGGQLQPEEPPIVLSLYDDFNDTQLDGSLNPAGWIPPSNSECEAVQQNGVLMFMRGPQGVGCVSTLTRPPLLTIKQLGVMEAQFRIGNYNRQGSVEQWLQFTSDLPAGRWWAQCGLVCSENGCASHVSIQDSGGMEYDVGGVPAAADGWYTYRLEMDSETMAVSCSVDGFLIGSAVPRYAEALRDAQFRRDLLGWRGNGGEATSYVDNVRVGTFVP